MSRDDIEIVSGSHRDAVVECGLVAHRLACSHLACFHQVRFFMEFLRAGFDLLCSDLDVVWLHDPRPYIMHGAAGTALLPVSGRNLAEICPRSSREIERGCRWRTPRALRPPIWPGSR